MNPQAPTDFFATPHLALPHALPYRAIFAELLQHSEPDLRRALPNDASLAHTPEATAQYLSGLIEQAEGRYRELEDLKRQHAELATVGQKELDCKAAEAPLKLVLHAMQNSALCLSGGGIRSATFSLGVMQGMARAKLLKDLDYLSTVSGGGYAGCWLMAWAKKETWPVVVDKLSKAAPTSGDPEPGPLRHLRDYSSYLNPSYGLSLDTATLAIIVLRNLILNWLMFAPALIFLLCVPVLFSCWTGFVAGTQGNYNSAMLKVAAVLLTFGIIFAMVRALKLPDADRYPSDESESGKEWLLLACPIVLGCWLVMLCWFHGDVSGQHLYEHFISPDQSTALRQTLDFSATHAGTNSFTRRVPSHDSISGMLERGISSPPFHGLFLVALAPMLAGWLVRFFWPYGKPRRLPARGKRLLAALACPAASLTFAGLLWGFAVLFSQDINGLFSSANSASAFLPDFITIFGLPVVTLLVMTGFAVQEGMLSHVETEHEREWWARGAGMLLLVVVWWVLLFGFALGTNMLVNLGGLGEAGTPSYTGTLGTALTLIGSWLTAKLGGSRFSGSGLGAGKADQMGKIKSWVSRNGWLPQVLAAAALAAIFFLLGTLAGYWRLHHTPWRADLALLACCFAIAVTANYFVNANTFSLHGMYRMRLVRAYLGASNSNRNPNPFTNFDPNDDMPLADVAADGAPMHIINCNLNLVDTKVLSWQQRMGESFTFSRVYAGSWRTGYVPTRDYAGVHGIKLGTAMAISGAAASPNMGYNSSPLMTLLMTLFNARLGWWLPNAKFQDDGKHPAIHDARLMRRNSPRWSMVPLVNEAIGRTDDRFKWIQLSDGGHFENLALYEMVMRRVKTIVLVDADADRTCQLGDLGNAVRKIYIDLGVPIEMDSVKMGEGIKGENHYCAIGRICYSCVDPELPDAAAAVHPGWDKRDGVLIYIKPQLNGNEPEDVLAYARSHASFPHETTANQFFSENQFESYRHLGSYVMEALTENGASKCDGSLASFISCCEGHVAQTKAADFKGLFN